MTEYKTISLQSEDMERFREFKKEEYGPNTHEGVPHRVALNHLLDMWEEDAE